MPPDSAAVVEALAVDPLGVLLAVARTGWFPGWLDLDSLAACTGEDPAFARVSAWAARMAGVPMPSAPAVSLMEFGEPTLLPTDVQTAYRPELVDAALRRVLHAFAEGSEPDSVEVLVRRVAEGWELLPDSTRILALEVFGRIGLDATGMLSDDDILRTGLRAAARYWSEIGATRSFPMAGECLPLEAQYVAACATAEEAGRMLSDPGWSVRYRALDRCGDEEAARLLGDPVPYVALRAALVRRDSGHADGPATLRILAAVPGPVGLQAVEALGREDSLLLRGLMGSTDRSVRAAAQSAWLSDSLPVDDALQGAWLSDPYWLIPVTLAWQLAESGDSLGAERVLCALLDPTETEGSAPEVREQALEIRDALRGVEPAVEAGWHGFDLPFDAGDGGPSRAVIHTDAGDFVLELRDDLAPVACAGFRYLAESGFYDGIAFHRVIPGFVAQCGCPDGNGTGSPGYDLPGEPSLESFERGVVGMADAGPGTAGSQFFVMLDHHGRLDGRYTAFGRVLDDGRLEDITVGTVITGITLEE